MAHVLAVKSAPIQTVKSLTLPSATYERWGTDHFTKLGGDSCYAKSAYITAALRWKSEQFAQVPFVVARETRNKSGRVKWETIENHPALPLLRMPGGTQPGAQSLSELKTRILNSIEIDGNAYMYRVLNGFGQTVRLRFMPFWATRPVRLPGSSKPVDYYEFTADGIVYRISPSRVIHWKQGVDEENELLGCSPLKAALRDVMTEIELSNYTATITKNQGSPRRAMMPETAEDGSSWDADFVNDVQDEYEMQSDNGLLVVTRPVKWQEFNPTPDKMGIDKLALIPKERIFAVLNVDPALVHSTVGFGDAKNTNARELLANGWKSSIVPMAHALCERLTLDLLPDFGDIRTERIEMDYTGVWALQEDLKSVHERTQKDFLANIIEQNEARGRYGLDEREGGERTHNEFPQLINGQADAADSILNGTNGKLPNETDRAQRQGTTEVDE